MPHQLIHSNWGWCLGILYGSQGKYLRDPVWEVATSSATENVRVNQSEPPLPQLDPEVTKPLGDDSPERCVSESGAKKSPTNPPALSH